MSQLILLRTNSGKLRIIDEAISKWKRIGDLLEFDDDGSKVSSFEKWAPEDALREIFRLWLQGNSAYKPVSWDSLATLLDDSGLKKLAQKVRNVVS